MIAPLNIEMGRRLGYMPGPVSPGLHGLGALGATYSVGQDPLTGEPATVDENGDVVGPVGYDASGNMIPLSPTGATSSGTPPAAVGGGAAPQIPSGSQLLYTATIGIGWGDLIAFGLANPGSMESGFASALPTGFSVLSSKVTAGGGAAASSVTIQWEILDSVGNQYVNDAHSIFDTAIKSVVGNNLQTSNINIVNTPNAALPSGTIVTPANPNAPEPLSTWFENNAVLILGIGAAVLVLPSLLGKRR